MNDQELARRLGHFDIAITRGKDDRFYASCACKWKARRDDERTAIEDATWHLTSAAERFRMEASKAGLTIVAALDRWNGRWRNYANGLLEKPSAAPRP